MKKIFLGVIILLLLISSIAYYKIKFGIESNDYSFISNKVFQSQLPDGSFPEFENDVDKKTHLYTTYYMLNIKKIINNPNNQINLSEFDSANFNNLDNIYYMFEIGNINDSKAKEKVKQFIESNQKDNGTISVYEDLPSKNQQEKDRLVLSDTYHSIKIFDKIGGKLNKEQEIKQWLINLLDRDYIINSPDTLKLVYDSLKIIDKDFSIKSEIMQGCLRNYFSKFQLNEIHLISGLIDLDSAVYLADKINFKIEDPLKEAITKAIKEMGYKTSDDVFFLYFTTDILKNIKALDDEYEKFVLNQIMAFDKYKMNDGTYSKIESKNGNVLTAYYAEAVLNIDERKDKYFGQLKEYLNGLVNKKEIELQKKVFNDAEGLYCLVNLIKVFNINLNDDIKKRYIDSLKMYYKINVDDPNIRQLFYATKALKLLNYIFDEDENKVVVSINNKYLTEQGTYNFPNKKSLIYSAMMVSIHKDMGLDTLDLEKAKEVFINDMKNSKETISVFYDMSALQIIDKSQGYLKIIEKNFIDSFRCENGYVLSKDSKTTFLYPTMCGMQIDRLIRNG